MLRIPFSRMSPTLASCLTLGFVLGLFYWNGKRKPQVSIGLWIPTIWMAIVGSRPVASWLAGGQLQTDTVAIENGTYLDGAIFLGLEVLAVLILMNRRVDLRNIFLGNRALWIFYH